MRIPASSDTTERKPGYETDDISPPDVLGRLSLAISAVAVVLFLIAGAIMPDEIAQSRTTFMGTVLNILAARHGYAFATAEKELIKQYNFLLRIFSNARRWMRKSSDRYYQATVATRLMNMLNGFSCTANAPSIKVKSHALAAGVKLSDSE